MRLGAIWYMSTHILFPVWHKLFARWWPIQTAGAEAHPFSGTSLYLDGIPIQESVPAWISSIWFRYKMWRKVGFLLKMAKIGFIFNLKLTELSSNIYFFSWFSAHKLICELPHCLDISGWIFSINSKLAVDTILRVKICNFLKSEIFFKSFF